MTAAFAALLLVFILGVAFSSIGMFLRERRDLSAVRGSAILGRGIRGWHFENLRPFEELCVRWNIRAAWLSYAQLPIAVLMGAAYATGLVFVGGWLVLCAGSIDIIDGRVARRTGGGSAQGAFLDSVIDRYADAFSYLGLAAFFADSWVLWVVLAGLVGSMMVSYTRARAEGLGGTCTVGLLQRPERYVFLGFGSIFGSLIHHLTGWTLWGQAYAAVVVVLIGLAVLNNVTALQRAIHVMRTLDGPLDE